MKMYLSVIALIFIQSINQIASADSDWEKSKKYYPYSPTPIPETRVITQNGHVYISTLPDEISKTKIFLIKNDKVIVFRRNGEYSYINYLNKKTTLLMAG